jgi:formylglycine-generating enzyme required for sulfatase activity/serine/threonine protein kinase
VPSAGVCLPRIIDKIRMRGYWQSKATAGEGPAMTLRTIGKYELLEEIGCGGFAVVYKARDTTLDRIVALKVLHPHWVTDPHFATRFRQEARAAANLRHPNIVTVHDTGEADGQLYIAMAYLPGRTLQDLLEEQGALPLEAALPILEQLADALDYAHAQGVIHRDVKPLNVMVEDATRGPRATLMDFGLVKALESSTALTSQGTLLGSPEYMAPEQADPNRHAEIGPATDRYALGIVAYRMLAGRVPFPGNTPGTLNAHLNLDVPDPRHFVQDLPPDVTAALLTMLAKAPTDRFSTASAFVTRLRETRDAERQRQAREKQLAAHYQQFQVAIQQAAWDDAIRIGQRIRQTAPDYADVARLLSLAQKKHRGAEAARVTVKVQQQQETRLAPLHAQLKTAADRQDWPEVLRIGRQIQALEPDDPIAAQWITHVQKQLRHPASRAQTVKPAHPANPPLPAWLKLVGIGLVAVILLGVLIGTLGPPLWDVLFATTTSTRTITSTATSTITATDTATVTPIVTPTKMPSPPLEAVLGDTWTRPQDRVVMVYVPDGTFQMGSNDEKPVHLVTLSAFWIDQTEVTVAQFRRFVQAQNYQTEAEERGESYTYVGGSWQLTKGTNWQHPFEPTSTAEDKHPVLHISWNDARTYCVWAGGQLPTEAQWEYAARGPEGYSYPWGNDFDCERGDFDDEIEIDYNSVRLFGLSCDGYMRTAPVGSFPEGKSWVNALDMAGNVWEWTADWYAEYSPESQTDPQGPADGYYRVVRGGSWNSTQNYVRSAKRDSYTPTNTNYNTGFRCVVVPVQE